MRDTKAIGSYWDVPGTIESTQAQTIESNMDFLIKFYEDQIEQRRWYGFWDHGDIMHTYDDDRHQWRYDVGGYAWDNSELSPDLFFWDFFLRTGRAETSLGLVRGMVFSTGRTAPNRLGSQLQSTVRPFTISLVVMSGLVTWYARSLMPTKPSFV